MTYTRVEAEQRSAEWWLARRARLCASDAKEMLAKPETSGRKKLITRLAVERMTGSDLQESSFTTAAMQRGIDKEGDARLAYEAATGQLAWPVGFLACNELPIGCSPEALLDDGKGGLEIKCPDYHTHSGYMRGGHKCPSEYLPQIKHSMLVTGAEWWDFASFDDRFPEPLRLFIVRVHRTDVDLDAYEKQVRAFLAEVDTEYQALMTMANPSAVLEAVANA
jgi:hypothetical protein